MPPQGDERTQWEAVYSTPQGRTFAVLFDGDSEPYVEPVPGLEGWIQISGPGKVLRLNAANVVGVEVRER